MFSFLQLPSSSLEGHLLWKWNWCSSSKRNFLDGLCFRNVRGACILQESHKAIFLRQGAVHAVRKCSFRSCSHCLTTRNLRSFPGVNPRCWTWWMLEQKCCYPGSIGAQSRKRLIPAHLAQWSLAWFYEAIDYYRSGKSVFSHSWLVSAKYTFLNPYQGKS